MNHPARRWLYLLTLWQERTENPGSPPVWRFSLEDARTGERQGFGSLEGLVTFLQARVEAEGIRNKVEG